MNVITDSHVEGTAEHEDQQVVMLDDSVKNGFFSLVFGITAFF